MNNEINMEILTNDEEIGLDIERNPSVNMNYETVTNKPQINGIELTGDKTSEDLGLQIKGDYANSRVTNNEIDNLF